MPTNRPFNNSTCFEIDIGLAETKELITEKRNLTRFGITKIRPFVGRNKAEQKKIDNLPDEEKPVYLKAFVDHDFEVPQGVNVTWEKKYDTDGNLLKVLAHCSSDTPQPLAQMKINCKSKGETTAKFISHETIYSQVEKDEQIAQAQEAELKKQAEATITLQQDEELKGRVQAEINKIKAYSNP